MGGWLVKFFATMGPGVVSQIFRDYGGGGFDLFYFLINELLIKLYTII